VYPRIRVYFHLGEIALREGEDGVAEQYFLKCIQENPQHRKARQYLEDMR